MAQCLEKMDKRAEAISTYERVRESPQTVLFQGALYTRPDKDGSRLCLPITCFRVSLLVPAFRLSTGSWEKANGIPPHFFLKVCWLFPAKTQTACLSMLLHFVSVCRSRRWQTTTEKASRWHRSPSSTRPQDGGTRRRSAMRPCWPTDRLMAT